MQIGWDAGIVWDTGTGWDAWMEWDSQKGSLLFCCMPGSGVHTCAAKTLAVFDLEKVCVFIGISTSKSQLPRRWLPSQGA